MREDLRYIETFIADKHHQNHPTDKLLADFIDNRLIDAKKEEIMLHLIECYVCREIVVNIKRDNISFLKTINLKKWTPILLVASSLLLFIFLPFKEDAILGMIDLSKAQIVEYQGANDLQLIEKIIDADKVVEEVLTSSDTSEIKYFFQALNAEEKEDFEEAKALYKQALISILHNPNAKERLRQKIVIHYKLLQLSQKMKETTSFDEYRNIVRYEIRIYSLKKEK